MANAKDLISKWLIEETFAVRKMEPQQVAGLNLAWGINVSTPSTPSIAFSVINPSDKPDRYILTLGIGISPEHKRELEKLKPAERLRVMNSIMARALMLCGDCRIAVQPNIIDPQFITINVDLFEEEVLSHGKPYFLRLLFRFLNTYIVIVSGFNEWFPILPGGGREGYVYTT